MRKVGVETKRRCGDCKNFIPSSSNHAAEDGVCNAYIEEDGLGKEVTLYMNASKCQNFLELERVRTNVSEFMWDQNLRMARGFDEK